MVSNLTSGLAAGVALALAVAAPASALADGPGHPLDPNVHGEAVDAPPLSRRHLDLFAAPLLERGAVSPSFEDSGDGAGAAAEARPEAVPDAADHNTHDMRSMHGATPGQGTSAAPPTHGDGHHGG